MEPESPAICMASKPLNILAEYKEIDDGYNIDAIPRVGPPFKLDNLSDLLEIAWYYKGDAIDYKLLWNLIPPLTDLNKMIGLESFKQAIVDLVICHVQALHISGGDSGMMHTVFYGSPGTGKTESAKILARLYCKLGILSKGHIVTVRRQDVIKGYVGQSDEAMAAKLEEALGGVLLFDEAYSLGQGKHTEQFSKALIDIINQFLSEHKDFVMIIAGYKDQIQQDFFSVNPGLERRFTNIFHFDNYTPSELRQIFLQKANNNMWAIAAEEIPLSIFSENKDYFHGQAGDMVELHKKSMRVHARRVFGLDKSLRNRLTREDVEGGMEALVGPRKKAKTEDMSESAKGMYL